jgi:hypothetical protein
MINAISKYAYNVFLNSSFERLKTVTKQVKSELVTKTADFTQPFFKDLKEMKLGALIIASAAFVLTVAALPLVLSITAIAAVSLVGYTAYLFAQACQIPQAAARVELPAGIEEGMVELQSMKH